MRLMRQARQSGLALWIHILLNLLTAVTIILQAYFLAAVTNRVFLENAGLQDVSVQFWYIAGLTLLRALLNTGSEISAKRISTRVKSSLREELLAKLTRLGPVTMAGEKQGEVLHTAFDGIEALDAFFSQFLPQIILSALIPLLILITVFPRDTTSGITLLLTAPLIPIFMMLIGSNTQKATGKQWGLMTRLSTHFYDTLQGLELLKQFNHDEASAEEIEVTDQAYRQATLKVLQYTFLTALVLELVSTISTAIVAVEIGLKLLYGQIDFQSALFILILAPEFYLPLRNLSARFHASMSGMEAATEIYKFLDQPEPPALPVTNPEAGLDFPIVFAQVGAGYPPGNSAEYSTAYAESEHSVLQDICCEIHRGEHLALVGKSGAGKTTLFNLLLRFLTPTAGQIMAGGTSLEEIPRATWLREIAWVPQNPYIFNASLAYNVTLQDPPYDEKALAETLQVSRLRDWMDTLPDGWNSLVGERGTAISSGQAQRVAIARALFKPARLILMDEPTSAVDPLLEEELRQATATLLQQQTTLTIAHRLPTIYQSDRIFFLENGRIAAIGTHTELIHSCETYARFVHRYLNETA